MTREIASVGLMLQNLITLVAACDDLSDGNTDVVAVLSGVRLRRAAGGTYGIKSPCSPTLDSCSAIMKH